MEYGFLAIYWRDMIKFTRSKAMIFLSLLQPVLWLVFYGISMTSNLGFFFPTDTAAPAGMVTANYMTFITSGVIGMTVLFTSLYSGQNLQFDRQYGLMKEIVVSPMSRSQILIGTTLSGVTKCLIQTAIIILFGYVVGARFFAGFSVWGIIISSFGLLLFAALFSTGFLLVSNLMGLKVSNHDLSQALMALLTLPLFFASNALYPVDTLPSVIKLITYVNPLTYFINGVRYLTIGPEFFSFGQTYSIGFQGFMLSVVVLSAFTVVMFLIANFTIKNLKDFV
ncbi:MAG: ABC transporter permease [Candidatus Bathyarchaeia archaeon]|jgi:ABC-2 type transport system permease protein